MTKSRIELVEDEGVVAEDVQQRLESLGYDVCAVLDNGVEAIRLAEETNPDLVLMDIGLNGEMDGIEAAGIIHKQLDIPIVFVTAHASQHMLARAKHCHPSGFLVKPIRQRELEAAIEMALDQHEKERAAKLAHACLEAALNDSGDGIMAVNAKGEVAFFNAPAEALTGWKSSEVLGKPWKEVFNLYDLRMRTAFEESVRRVLRDKGGSRLPSGVLLQARDGSAMPLAIKVAFINATQGADCGVMVAFRRVRPRDGVEAERDRFFRISADMLCIAGYDGYFKKINAPWQEVLGWTVEELKAKPFLEFVHPDDRGATVAATEKLVQGGNVVGFDNRYLCRDGSYKWLSWCSASAPEDQLIYAVAREVTQRKQNEQALLAARDNLEQLVLQRTQALQAQLAERKRAEGALRESEERYRKLVAFLPDAILVHDGTHCLFGNEAAAQLLGVTHPEKIRGCSLRDFYPPGQQTSVQQRIQQVLQGERTPLLEQKILRVDGQQVGIESAECPITYDGRPAVLAVLHDISERQRLQEHLFQAQKMEAIGSLASGVAHDFNNLLTAILGYSEILMLKFPPDNSLRSDLEQINLAGKRAAALTRQLLAFSRKQVMQPRLLDLNALISDLEKMLRRMIGEDIEMNTLLEPGLGAVNADPSQLQQVIMNLAVNSRDAMPQGGKITIETANIFIGREGMRRRHEIPPGEYVQLSLSDNGSGMDRETLSRIFEPFFTTKGQGRGTGLGLSTVYGIIKQSQGFIWVYSELGQGTTFKIYLPRAYGQTEVRSNEPVTSAKIGGTETVLLVEDDASVRALAKRVLCEEGYTVLTATNGKDALQQARRFSGPIHLLLTDVVLPSMNGKVLASQIRLLRPATQVLYMSGYTNNAIVQYGMLELGVEILEKPFVRASLIEQVRHRLDQHPLACSVLVVDSQMEVRASIRRNLEQAGFSVFDVLAGQQGLELLESHPIKVAIVEMPILNGKGKPLTQRLKQAHPKLSVVAMLEAEESVQPKVAGSIGVDAILHKPLQADTLLSAVRRLLSAEFPR